MPYFQASDPKSDEPWASFLSRAAAETLAYLRAPDGKFANDSGIIRAFDSTTTSADGNEQIVPAIEDTIESLRYAITRSDPDRRDDRGLAFARRYTYRLATCFL